MIDDELDELLASAATDVMPAAAHEAVALADATMPHRLRRGRPVRARWFGPVIMCGSLALTAGAGVAVVEMSHWAGVGMPTGTVRNLVPIPVNWATDDGHTENCRAWIELQNAERGDRAALDAAIAARDWTGFGQRLYDQGVPVPEDADGEGRVADQLYPFLQEFARDVMPGVTWFVEPGDTFGVTASGMTCVPEQS